MAKITPLLHLGDGLDLPTEAVTQTFAILAKRGAGKTYTANVMAEEMLKANLHVVIVDPIGVWWGLRASADGKSEGLPIIIAGGDHADIPLDATNGELLAELIVRHRLSMVIDLSLLRKNEQNKFMVAFAETLYRINRNALHLILDEADAFAPQRPFGDEARMLGAIEDIVRRGRARGLGVTMITQRPSVLNKNVLTQIEVLIALRLTAPLDQKAIDEWVRTHAEENQRGIFMKSLPSLPIGTAWFWSPGWLDLFKKIKVRTRETFDSSSTPKVGQLVERPKLASVDLEAIKEQLAATIDQAAADDPVALKRKVAELQAQLRDQKPQIEVREVLPVGFLDDLNEAIDSAIDLGLSLKRIRDKYAGTSELNKIFGPTPPVTGKGIYDHTFNDAKPTKPAPIILPADQDIQIIEGDTTMPSGERRLIDVLTANYPLQFTRAQLATLAKFKATGGTYGTYFSDLKRRGFLEVINGLVVVTPAGMAYMGRSMRQDYKRPDEIRQMWREVLSGGPLRIYDMITGIYPRAISKDNLAAATNFTPTGGTFGTYLSTLKRNGLITVKDNKVKAHDALFREGK
jgi:hypothetical protein